MTKYRWCAPICSTASTNFCALNGPEEKQPFGGVQMIFIGDLYQLPPVVTSAEREIFKTSLPEPYFFSAKVFDQLNIELSELEKVYRQKDDEFVRLLNTIRNRSVTDDDLAQFNSRCDPQFEAPAGFLLSVAHQHQCSGRHHQRKAPGRTARQSSGKPQERSKAISARNICRRPWI